MNPTEDKKNGGAVAKKIIRIAADVLVGIILVFALFTVIVTVSSNKSEDGAATVFGYQLRFVLSGSMEKSEYTDVSGYKIKSIRTKSCVFVKVAPKSDAEKQDWYGTLKVGDVLTFRYYQTGSGGQQTITHRLVNLERKDGGYVLTLEGDNRSSEDGVVQQVIDTANPGYSYVIGKVTGQSYFLGLCVYALRQPVGIILIIIVPCALMIVLQVIRIAKAVSEDKKEKLKTEQSQKDDEIENLKRQLAELKAEKRADETVDGK